MSERNSDVRKRIIQAAAELLARDGREAVSTRAVSVAAGVQPPTIYRQFGDMQGLLNVVAHETFAEYVRQKTSLDHADDPIEELRRGWDLHVAFGIGNPAVYAILNGDPRDTADTPAAHAAYANLHEMVARVAEAGRLRVSVAHATHLIAAAGEGVTLSLISTPPDARDLKLSATMREAVIAAITIAPTSDGDIADLSGSSRVAARAVALHAVLAEVNGIFSLAELQLLGEWLDRLASTDG